MAVQQHNRARRRTPVALAVLLLILLSPLSASTARPSTESMIGPAPLVGRPFAPVLERLVVGDLVMAGNSNLLSAGGWRDTRRSAADVDGDATLLCVRRRGERATAAACAENSSSAHLDVPPNARVLAARLYVETSTGRNLGPLQARLDGPAAGFSYRLLPAGDPSVVGLAAPQPINDSFVTPSTLPDPTASLADPAKLYEAVANEDDGAELRHAVWDVTDFVQAGGPGSYTVADIVNERSGPWLPYASWAIVVAYELAPGVQLASLTPGEQSRFATRLVSWHDGFLLPEFGAVEVPINGLPARSSSIFGKSFHVIAHGRRGSSDNLLFDDGPVGNNLTPGDTPPPAGVVLGTDPACNTITDVQNDTICLLGTNVATKAPGAADYVVSSDGRTPSSGSGVDMDVIRIPDRILWAAPATTTLRVQLTGADRLAPAVLAVSIDAGGAPS